MRAHRLAYLLLAATAITMAAGPRIEGPTADPDDPLNARRATQDSRTPIVLPAPARAAILSEMRGMLRALHGVLNAMAQDDREAMQQAASSGGMAIAADTDPGVQQRLPKAFLQLGVGTHQAFDSLAAAIERGAGTDLIIRDLAGLTSRCVSCHASYRIETP